MKNQHSGRFFSNLEPTLCLMTPICDKSFKLIESKLHPAELKEDCQPRASPGGCSELEFSNHFISYFS